MATKKREIYARLAVQLRTHDRALCAEQACPGAMGLYAWMLIQARGEETDGDVLEASALTAWGAPTAFRRRQVDALIASGLVERRGKRLAVVRYADHNDTPAEIETNRAATRSRVTAHRKAHVTRYIAVTNADVPCSSFNSDLGSADHRSEDPDSTPRATPDPASEVRPLAELPDPLAAPPEWWLGAVESIAASTLGATTALNPAECWFAYAGHRATKRRPANRSDACSWLTTVMVPKAREAVRVAARDRERDAKFDATRDRAKGGPPEPRRVSPEQAEREAQDFVRRIKESREAAARKGVA